MVSPEDPSAFNQRIEELTGRLQACLDDDAQACARELVHLILDFHGAGLKRILAIAGPDDSVIRQRLAADPVVGALLELHDLPASPAVAVSPGANHGSGGLIQITRNPSGPHMPPANVHGEAVAVCERCGASLPELHNHFVDLTSRRLSCSCRACWLLSAATRPSPSVRPVPDRYLRGPALRVDPEQWQALQIPVSIAFFMINGAIGRTIAFYPSPAGATESALPLTAWREVETANPWLRIMAADVEALLVRQIHDNGRDAYDGFIVPIDACYDLVGRIRLHWTGFAGGDAVRNEIDRFFSDVAGRSVSANLSPSPGVAVAAGS